MLPIIFIHNQNSSYLPLSLWQARKSNPASEVILIGDDDSSHFGFIVRHADKKDYFQGASEFAKRFRNFSSNPHDFELICLQRWFILEEFLILNGIEKCLYLDSDILQFGDAAEDSDRFSAFGMTVAGISGHSNFIYRTETLTDFCNFIMKSYDGPEAISVLEKKYAEFQEKHDAGGISDMTFFVEYKELHPDRIIDIGNPIQERMYDISMNYIEYVQNNHGMKVARKAKNGKVYVRHNIEGMIQMQSLHFQGEAKKIMKKHLFSWSPTLEVIYQLNRLILLYQKIRNKFFR
jgi:hypothetical protein